MSLFSDRLIDARKRAGFTQKELAKALQITATRLNYWEKGKREPNIEMIKNISNILKVNPDYLIGNEDNNSIQIEILDYYNKLNDLGKQRANEYIQDLSEQAKYTNNNISDDIINELKQIATAPMSDTIKQK